VLLPPEPPTADFPPELELSPPPPLPPEALLLPDPLPPAEDIVLEALPACEPPPGVLLPQAAKTQSAEKPEKRATDLI
jgi:hypothetical protein